MASIGIGIGSIGGSHRRPTYIYLFWLRGVWGSPSGRAVWSFDKWGQA